MGALTLPAAGSVYVEANTVIYAVEKIEPYSSFLVPLCPLSLVHSSFSCPFLPCGILCLPRRKSLRSEAIIKFARLF